MSTFTSTIRRHEPAFEIKIPVAAARSEDILAWVRELTEPDPFAGGETGDVYQVTSLYFDTEHFDVFHRRGSFGRSKYRIRRYDLSDQVFLERKLRVGKGVHKRRSVAELEELSRLTNGVRKNGWSGSWFQRRLLLRRLNPVCQVAYRRVARMTSTSEGQLRITLDQNIEALALSTPTFEDKTEPVRIATGCTVLELKFPKVMPALFKHLIEDFSLEPQPFSKYRLAASKLGCVREETATQEAVEVPEPAHA